MNVLERIKSGEKSCCVYEVNFHGYGEEEQENKDTDELIKLAEIGQRMQWVSVEDRLPEEGKEVLLSDVNCGISCGWLKKDGISWVNYGECGELTRNFNFITHWMPLPPNP